MVASPTAVIAATAPETQDGPAGESSQLTQAPGRPSSTSGLGPLATKQHQDEGAPMPIVEVAGDTPSTNLSQITHMQRGRQ